MNWLMLPIFTSNFSIQAHSLLMQNFYRGSQALIAPFPENFFTVRRQGSVLPGSPVLCPAKELLPQAQLPWLALAELAGGHRRVAERRAQVHQRKSTPVQTGNSKAR